LNAINVIHPYRADGTWVFDDPAVGLRREPFVSGADRVIDRMVESLPDAEQGFTLVFSAQPFSGAQAEFECRRAESGGNWYYSRALDIEGWLCPTLLKYFEVPPARIHAEFKSAG
jgi:hypothetical protein